MTVLTQFFCKMYFLYVSRGRKNFWGEILCVLPLQKPFFFSTPGSSSSFTKIADYEEMTICFTEATRLFIIISNAGATIFEMEPQFLKNATPHEKKVSLTPQKSENEVPQKSLSPNPLWHVHFAKNQVQFGIFWPLEPHF